MRLTPAESLALRRVLTTCDIGDDVRGRVEAALCADPEADFETTTVDKTMGGDRLLGGFYPVISEAIAIGARLAISYRAGDECSPSTRLVDPKFIEVSGDAAYLVAWNVEKDAQRSYRLDRIANAELTDDSVERHDFSPYSAAESLRAHGADATLRFVNSGELASRDWEGIRRRHRGRARGRRSLGPHQLHVRALGFSHKSRPRRGPSSSKAKSLKNDFQNVGEQSLL